MRHPISALSTCVAALLFASGPAGAQETSLLRVADVPELAAYAAKVRDVLRQHGKACETVTEMNAFPVDGGLKTLAACDGGRRYEILFEGSAVTIHEG